jgi:hypothetical protein
VGVPNAVVHRGLEPSISARAEWIEQNPVQGLVVVSIEVAPCGRVLTAPVSVCSGHEEVVNPGADDVAAAGSQNNGQFVGERGLPRGGRSIDGNSRRVREGDGRDHLSQPTEEIVASA